MADIVIANKKIGNNHPCFIIAEIGINHNGDINIAKKLIDLAVEYGFDAVKFQKRTIEEVYTKEELAKPRENPFGPTNGDLKKGLEFNEEEYKEIDEYCKQKNIIWFASPWDIKSIEFLEKFNIPCYKIPSALLTDKDFLQSIQATGKPILLSTGMSTEEQIDKALNILKGSEIAILHCTSTYPSKLEELNLEYIRTLQKKYPNYPIGYSGHEPGLLPSVIATSYGAALVERHVTTNRTLWGSDHAASLEPRGMELLVRDIRTLPLIKGNGIKKIYDTEKPIIEKLRKKDTI